MRLGRTYCCDQCEDEISGAWCYRRGKKIYCSEECAMEALDVVFEWIEEDEYENFED